MDLYNERKPSPMMAEDKQLLSIFPEEIWLIILNELMHKNSNRAYQLYQKVLPFFQTILRPQLNRILFPSMLNTFHKWYHNQSKPNRNINNAVLVLLPFRRICRKWKNDVGKLLESRLCITDFYNEIKYEIGDTMSNLFYEFSDVESLQAFQQNFADTHLPFNANPLVTAAVKFNFTDFDLAEMQNFLQECVNMLTNYGAHIRSCVINMQSYSWYCCLIWLRRTLNLMPNLISLRTSRLRYPAGLQNRHHLGFNFIQNIPKLQHLEFLETEMLPTDVANELLLQNGHVPKVETKVTDETVSLPFLQGTQELSVSIDMIVLLSVKPRANYPVFHWQQLRKLELNQRGSDTKLTRLFRFLEYHFANTLQELRLFVPNSITDDMPAGLLRLKNLQVLKLHLPEKYCIPKKICSLNFIVPLKHTLQELSVWRELESNYDIDSDECFGLENNKYNIEFFSVRSEFQKSNMWILFPQLEKLSYICYGKGKSCCTRQHFNKYKPN